MSEKVRALVDFLAKLREDDPSMTPIVLVRHGRTAYNAQRRFLGRTDIELDDVGKSQASKLTALRGVFREVFSSPMRRATQTAAFLSDEVQILQGVEELDQADLEGLFVAEAVKRFPDYFSQWELNPASVCAPGGGESLEALQQRAVRAIQRVQPVVGGGPIAIVTHQLVIAVLSLYASGEPLARWKDFTVGNIGMAVLGLPAGAERIRFITNEVES